MSTHFNDQTAIRVCHPKHSDQHALKDNSLFNTDVNAPAIKLLRKTRQVAKKELVKHKKNARPWVFMVRSSADKSKNLTKRFARSGNFPICPNKIIDRSGNATKQNDLDD